MGTRTLVGTQRFDATIHASALVASAGLLVASPAALAGNNPQNGPAPILSNGPDLDGSGRVDFADLTMLLSVMGNPAISNPAWVAAADVNRDGVVNFLDLSEVLSTFGQVIPPAPPPPVQPPVDPPVTVPPEPETPPVTPTPEPENPPPASPTGSVIDVGSGFFGPLTAPQVVGDPNAPGADAKAIARWNAIPGQFITGQFHVGVVAFHMNGINRVEFVANGGEMTVVEGRSINPTTGNREFWVTINADELPEGPVELRAIVYPNTGVPRVLQGETNADSALLGEHSLILHVRHGDAPAVYVSHNGNDSNPGTRQAPFKTIGKAIRVVPDGGDVVLLDRGEYIAPNNAAGSMRRDNQRWITVRPDAGMTRDDVVITNTTRTTLRPNLKQLRWQSVSIDLAMVSQVYNTLDHMAWLDDVRLYDAEGWTATGRPSPVRNPWFATNCLSENTVYAFTNATIVRNSHAQQVAGDVFQNAALVIGCTADNVDGRVQEHHTDLYQMWGSRDNIIVADVTATNLKATQAFFLEPTYQSGAGSPINWLRNAAFVNIKVDTEPVFRWSNNDNAMLNWGGAPWSQMLSRFDHILFENVELANQRLMLRSDVTSNQAFQAKNVVFRNVGLHPMTYDSYLGVGSSNLSGVQFVNCYSHPDAAVYTGD